ncbi:protein of unknown function (plasmid) [Thermococcus nautili]|nr:hypothetical protein [Thermococcus nautili]CAI1494155.1 protein of unknown function [Thermococcus nautili]
MIRKRRGEDPPFISEEDITSEIPPELRRAYLTNWRDEQKTQKRDRR